jgi:hypothetical protein
MGIKKIGKKLMKIGKKAGKSLGKGGSEFVESVLQTAIGTLETELEKRGATSAKKPGVQAARQSEGRGPAGIRSAKRHLPQEAKKRGAPASKRPHHLASTSRAAGEQPRRPRAAVSPTEQHSNV